MGKGMHGWIAETLDRGARDPRRQRRVAADRRLRRLLARLLGRPADAVTLPALDGASKERAPMAVEFVARQVPWGTGARPPPRPPAGRSKEWMQSNFRVELGELPCNRVMRVDALTWTCAADGTVTVPDLRLVDLPRRPRALGGGGAALVHRPRVSRQARDERQHHPARRQREGRARRDRARQRRAPAILARRGRRGRPSPSCSTPRRSGSTSRTDGRIEAPSTSPSTITRSRSAAPLACASAAWYSGER